MAPAAARTATAYSTVESSAKLLCACSSRPSHHQTTKLSHHPTNFLIDGRGVVGREWRCHPGCPPRRVDGVAEGSLGFAEGDGFTTVCTGTRMEVGESENTFEWLLEEGTLEGDYEISTVFGTLTVEKASSGGEGGEEPGGETVPEGGLSVFDTTLVYDGGGHTIDTNALEAAFAEALIGEFTVEYAVAEEEPSEGWVVDAPLFTNVCATTVWYRVCSPNYEAFVHAARVTVTARPVEVRVTGARRTFGYDGEEKVVSGYVLETKDYAPEPKDGLFDAATAVVFTGTAEARRTDAGTTPMVLLVSDFENTDPNFVVSFVVAEGWVEVTPADISEGEFEVVLGANPKYDGTGDSMVEVESATWQGLPVTFVLTCNSATDAGRYQLKMRGTGNFTGWRWVDWAVLPRVVTLTSADANKVYDGEALTAQEVSVGGDGWADGEGAEYSWTGVQVDAGESENTFGYTLSEGTKAGNYVITTVFGTLRVTPGVIDPVAVFGAERPVCEKVFNGDAQTFEMDVEFAEPWQLLFADGKGSFGETAPTLTHVADGEMEVAFRFVSANYETFEGTAGFRITQAANEWVVLPGIAGWTEGDAAADPTGQAQFGTMEVAYRAQGAAPETESRERPEMAGLYVARFWVEETPD